MKYIKALAPLFLISNFCSGQSAKEQQFKTTIHEIIKAFSVQDSTVVSKYISPAVGVYQLDRIGVYDHYNHFKTITFSEPTYSQVLFQSSKGIRSLPLKYAKLPDYDCEKESWNKKGLYVDTTTTDHLLSKICKRRNQLDVDSIPNEKIQFFYQLETKSRRVVLSDDNNLELVFYV